MSERADNNEDLKMSFDPNTIQHLGIKMYSSLPPAIAELVANAYDACSRSVRIKIYDTDDNRSIVVEDDGSGMAYDDLNNKFLIIGRNRREEGLKETECGRIATGKKGLGKLALFGIGEQIDIETTKLGQKSMTKVSLVWADLKKWDRKTQGPDYKPAYSIIECPEVIHGTKITISNLKRKTKIDQEYINSLAVSLSKLFCFLDENFKVTLTFNDGDEVSITNELRYGSIERQFTWNLPDFSVTSAIEYENREVVKGLIFTSPRPLPNKKQTGITLYAHGRRVNEAEFFGHLESSNFFSYATGWLEVDFVDDYDEELISTDRKSIDWEHEDMIKLRQFLRSVVSKVHSEWRRRRRDIDNDQAGTAIGVDRAVWFSTLPPDKAEVINKALEEVSDPDSTKNPAEILFETSHQLAPEYAEKHWRYLHEKITQNEAIDRLYTSKSYFQAASEAVKLYVEDARTIGGVSTATEISDNNAMGMIFGKDVTKRISLTDRSDAIEADIEQGQMLYSQGVVTGFKNPVTSHATEGQLRNRGLFSEKDCLDILSLVSHLFNRLENRRTPTP